MNAGRHNTTIRGETWLPSAEQREAKEQVVGKQQTRAPQPPSYYYYPPSGTPFRSSRSPVRRQRLDYRKQTMDRFIQSLSSFFPPAGLMIRSLGRKPESGKVAPICCRCRHAGSNVTHAPAPNGIRASHGWMMLTEPEKDSIVREACRPGRGLISQQVSGVEIAMARTYEYVTHTQQTWPIDDHK